MRQLKGEEEALLARTVLSMEGLAQQISAVRQQQGYWLTNLELTVQQLPPVELGWQQVGVGLKPNAHAALSPAMPAELEKQERAGAWGAWGRVCLGGGGKPVRRGPMPDGRKGRVAARTCAL